MGRIEFEPTAGGRDCLVELVNPYIELGEVGLDSPVAAVELQHAGEQELRLAEVGCQLDGLPQRGQGLVKPLFADRAQPSVVSE